MLIVNLKDQLGNQMFAYASIKSIALRNGYEFRFYRTELNKKYVNDTDSRYGNEIHTVFKNLELEKIDYMPNNYRAYTEMEHLNKSKMSLEYLESAEKVNDNTIMDGHFLSTKYFESNLNLVRKWFVFPEDVHKNIEEKFKRIKSKNQNRPIVSVHFRVGTDYLTRGFKLDDKYWFDAANHIKNHIENPLFIVFYDKLTKNVKKFIKKYNAIDCRGSLIEDMCFIHICDANIVCNSSFSIISAILNKNSKMIIRPSKYPVSGGYFSNDIFMSDWHIVGKGNRSFVSNVFNILWKLKHFKI